MTPAQSEIVRRFVAGASLLQLEKERINYMSMETALRAALREKDEEIARAKDVGFASCLSQWQKMHPEDFIPGADWRTVTAEEIEARVRAREESP